MNKGDIKEITNFFYEIGTLRKLLRMHRGKGNENINNQYKNLQTNTAKEFGRKILESEVSSWWENLWTEKNR